ncbi:MAG: molybdopterin-dependent oxidoreductase [Gammaproteobacteria bacterium]|nr:molybdopterin-dependent oxidoreductase [Gammaproteobacteria bacterium]
MSDIDRRNFVKLGAAAATATAACPAVVNAMELELGGKDFHQIRTFHPREKKPYLCTMCPWFDGGFTYAEDGVIKKAEGNPDHIATRGKFCSKGLASFFGASDPDRILAPLKRVGERGAGQWQEISWEEAIAELSAKVLEALDDPNSIVLNEGGFKEGGSVRFMDTIGSQSVIRSRLPSIGTAPKQIALEEAVGFTSMLPDLEHTKYILNFGANIMETAPPLAQRLTDGVVNSRLKLVTFDVRMSNTAGRSDEWIPVFPGSDGIVALAMANIIMQKGLMDEKFINTWTNYSSKKLAAELEKFTPEIAEKASGVPVKTIKKIAVEFAKTKPATVMSQNGLSWHQNGINAEMACLTLAVITGNIDNEGGYCLPRQFDVAAPEPIPKLAGSQSKQLNPTFPFEVMDGSRQVALLINHMSNPGYSSPAASVWREVLQDEEMIPYLVDFSPFMSETAELADIILPDVVDVERHEVASSPTALWPWIGMSYPKVTPRGQAQDVRMTLKQVIETIDPDGSRGMRSYWEFADVEEWTKQVVKATSGTEKKTYKKLKSKGVWPSYGKIDPATRQIVKKGVLAEAEYNTYRSAGFPTPSGKIELRKPAWSENPKHADLQSNQFVLTTFKVANHSLSMTSNLKYLSELWHANPLWVNRETALRLEIGDADLVRVTTAAGYMVTKAWLTSGIHPQTLGMSTSVGRTAYGRVAQANPHAHAPSYARHEQEDPDIEHNLWWRDNGVNPNDIMPVAIDPETGAQIWNDSVVTLSRAEPGDKYGDIEVDNTKHFAVYKDSQG